MQREKEPEPGRDEKVKPPGGATRFVGKMLAYCVQDATVVDVEKRRNPSKHYVSTASTDSGKGLASLGEPCPQGQPLAPEFVHRAVISRKAFSVLLLLPCPGFLFLALQLASGCPCLLQR